MTTKTFDDIGLFSRLNTSVTDRQTDGHRPTTIVPRSVVTRALKSNTTLSVAAAAISVSSLQLHTMYLTARRCRLADETMNKLIFHDADYKCSEVKVNVNAEVNVSTFQHVFQTETD